MAKAIALPCKVCKEFNFKYGLGIQEEQPIPETHKYSSGFISNSSIARMKQLSMMPFPQPGQNVVGRNCKYLLIKYSLSLIS